jgi:hypothetical protein
LLSKALNQIAGIYPLHAIGGMRFKSDLAGSEPGGVTFSAGSTVQCSIRIDVSTGTISIVTGALDSAVVIQTSSISVTANAIHYLEWNVAFGAAAAYNVYLDGNPTPILTGTGNTTNTVSGTISSGTYNSGTGAVSLTMSSAHGLQPGDTFTQSSTTGTGSFASLNGTHTATAGTAGTILNYTAATSLTLTITGGSTSASVGHTTAIGVGTKGSTGGTFVVDDLYVFDETGTTCNQVLLTNPRIASQFANADVQTQFTPTGLIIGSSFQGYTSTSAPGANELFLRSRTPLVGGTLQSVSCLPEATSGGAKFKAVIYPDVSGKPDTGSLIATGAEVVGATAGTILTSAFGTPPALTANTPYWIGFITDTSVGLAESNTTTNGVKAANTYTSGAPGTCPTTTAGQPDWLVYGTMSAPSVAWPALSSNPAQIASSYVQDVTPGDEWIGSFPPIVTPTSIVGVATVVESAVLSVAGSGLRTVALTTKSGGTDSVGQAGAFVIATGGPLVYESGCDLDPNGNVAWTQTSLNAAAAGITIVT